MQIGWKEQREQAVKAKAEAEEYASKYEIPTENAIMQNENKPKMFSVVQQINGKSVNDNDHPFTTQMNYLIEINDKYANDAKDPAPIFYNSGRGFKICR